MSDLDLLTSRGTSSSGKDGRLKVRTIADRLYHILREQITRGEFQDNEPIRQDILAARLGISKIPLREALARLEQDGLVTSLANRGFIVRPLTREEADEVFMLRLHLEPAITAAGSEKADEDDRRIASEALKNLEASWDAPPERWADCNRAFHLALIRPGTGLLAYNILERLHAIAERYVLLHLKPYSRRQRATREHAEILKLWLNREYASIQRLTHKHIEQTRHDLVQSITST